jgi:hypothetical protein
MKFAQKNVRLIIKVIPKGGFWKSWLGFYEEFMLWGWISVGLANFFIVLTDMFSQEHYLKNFLFGMFCSFILIFIVYAAIFEKSI